MTLIACDGHMQAEQWKFRQVVLEICDWLPALLQMTLVALCAEPSLVNVARLVAINAFSGEFARAERACVAGMAIDLRVFTREPPMTVAPMIESR